MEENALMTARSGDVAKPRRKVVYDVVGPDRVLITRHDSNYDARLAARGHRGARVTMTLVDDV